MRKIESDMLKCVGNSRALIRGNTKVIISRKYGNTVTLFSNTIATFDEDLFITLFDGGWRTVTTKSRLNALLFGTGYGIAQVNFEWRLTYRGQDRGIFKNNTTFYIGDGT